MSMISVIIPIYNTEKYVEKCIRSVCTQTYTDLDIILVNDGSTDSSKKICESFLNDGRVRIVNQMNQGQGKARNVGIEMANGSYLFFLDSDDYLEKDCLEVLYRGIINHDADISIIDYYDIDEKGKKLKKSTRRCNDVILYGPEAAVEDMLYWKTFGVAPWAKLYKKALWDEIRFPENIIYEDLATTYKVFAKASRVVFLPYPKMYYLHRMGSDVHQPFNNRKLSIMDSSNSIKEFVSQNMRGIYKAAISREFSSAFSLYLQIENDNLLKDKLKAIIIKERTIVMFDPKARNKARCAAFLSFFGFRLCKFVFLLVKK